MSKRLYFKLAASNLKNNRRFYAPYILSCIITIVMFYNMGFLTYSESLKTLGPGSGDSISMIMNLGIVILAIFSAIFLFYTYSFLIKRRKKEFGLYNILGMDKKHISIVVSIETLYSAFISLILGIGGGILISKLMLLSLTNLLHQKVSFGFEVSSSSIIVCLCVFGAIFFLSFLNTLRQIYMSKPIDLMRGGQTGEKEPKTKWLLSIIGVICLGIGYYIALTTEEPLEALSMFFLAVLLVIIGTYCLFTSISIAFLKMLRKNKRYYYKTKHFTAVSGMIYRMKQNAVGLANICILSTMVLVMISTTTSLYFSTEDILRSQYPNDISFRYEYKEKSEFPIEDFYKENNIEAFNKTSYTYLNMMCLINESENEDGILTEADSYRHLDVTFTLLEDYNRLENANLTLRDKEIFLYTNGNEMIEQILKTQHDDEKLLYTNTKSTDFDTLKVIDDEYTVKSRLSSLKFIPQTSIDTYYIVVVKDINVLKDIAADSENIIAQSYGFDVNEDDETMRSISDKLRTFITVNNKDDLYKNSVSCVGDVREQLYGMYGGLLFLGIFLGIVFIVAAVLIIYYKQISEGYDDKERFEIMQKVGMSRKEVKKSIKSQVLTVFFLPLITACIHIAVAFGVIKKLMYLLMFRNESLFLMCLIVSTIVFALLYALVYAVTARIYYKITASK